jgi:hypothetical protein
MFSDGAGDDHERVSVHRFRNAIVGRRVPGGRDGVRVRGLEGLALGRRPKCKFFHIPSGNVGQRELGINGSVDGWAARERYNGESDPRIRRPFKAARPKT